MSFWSAAQKDVTRYMVQWETLQPYAIAVSAVSALGVSAYR